MFANGETVTILTAAPVTDPYSDDASESWDNPTSVDVAGVGVEPRPSSEPVQDARNAVTSGFTLYLPAGTAITARNRVIVRGGKYSVIGDAAEWRSPFTGWQPGIVVQVERTEG